MSQSAGFARLHRQTDYNQHAVGRRGDGRCQPEPTRQAGSLVIKKIAYVVLLALVMVPAGTVIWGFFSVALPMLVGCAHLERVPLADCDEAEAASACITPLDPNAVLTVTSSEGESLTLTTTHWDLATRIYNIGRETPDVGDRGIIVALTAALTESRLAMLDHGDRDSLGMFQMRPSAGWGTEAELMDPDYQVRAFYGGPTGPNQGSPPGLLDHPGWEQMTVPEAAQDVEVSAHPDRYAHWEGPALTIFSHLLSEADGEAEASDEEGEEDAAGQTTQHASQLTWPLDAAYSTPTGNFRPPGDPGHDGVDFDAPLGTPIYAVADGVVVSAEETGDDFGTLIKIEHVIDDEMVETWYAHMPDANEFVEEGDSVDAGEQIASVGQAGTANRPHLHFEVHPDGEDPINPYEWLQSNGASTVTVGNCGGTGDISGVTPPQRDENGGWPPEERTACPDPSTGTGCVTPRTKIFVDMVTRWGNGAFTSPHDACYSQRGYDSEHTLGRACDIFFSEPAVRATGAGLDNGWKLVHFLSANADTWAVHYIIWQGRIWNIEVDGPYVPGTTNEQWGRPYEETASGCDPAGATCGHYDHVHVTIY